MKKQILPKNMKFFILLATFAYASALRFDGDQVLTLYPKTQDHLELLKEFGDLYDMVDFWSPDSASGVELFKNVDIRFVRSALPMVMKKLNDVKMRYRIKIEDVQKLVDNQFNMRKPTTRSSSSFDYNVYHTYKEINVWIEEIANEFPSLAKKSYFATSYEGRDVNMLTLGSSSTNPVFLIDCGVHAREWISPAWCTNFVYKMVSEYETNQNVQKMMDGITWMIIPLYNVDGYEYSRISDRMWRKTRSNYGTFCTGVDANRNFDKNWSGEGASGNSCSDTYYGPSVESEPIVAALSNIIRDHTIDIWGYIAFHSYSQVFVFPYSYDYVNTENFEELMNVSRRASDAIFESTEKIYTYGPGHQSMYLVSGGSKDFAYDQNIPLSYTIELRDTGRYGFILPESEIAGTSKEMFQAMIVLADEVMELANNSS